jgi:hypothetical protein
MISPTTALRSFVLLGIAVAETAVPVYSASNQLPLFAHLKNEDVIWGASDTLRLPGDGRPWVIVIFKACCASNRSAVRWAVEARERYGDQVGFLGVNTDYARSLSKVTPWLAAQKANFPVIQDPAHILLKEFRVIAVPTLIILNPEGEEIYALAGFRGINDKTIQEILGMNLHEKHSDDKNP